MVCTTQRRCDGGRFHDISVFKYAVPYNLAQQSLLRTVPFQWVS